MTSVSTATNSSVTALPADAFPEWPMGWYVVARSHQLSRKPLGVALFGRELVAASRGEPTSKEPI
jgi:phenylpropionate dioxygenase-like ring-hydroxylating dioxygenase large terminal subunit